MTDLRQTRTLASRFKSDSLRRRFAVGVTVMLLPMLFLGGASVFAYEQNVAAGDKLANRAVSELLPMADLSASLRQAQLLAYGVVFAGTPDLAYKGNAGGIDQAFTSILAGTELGEERGAIEMSRQHWTSAKAAYERTVHSAPLMKLAPEIRLRLHQQALGGYTASLDQAIGSAGLASHVAADSMRTDADDAKALQDKMELLLALTGLAAIFAAALIARRLSRSVIDPIVRLQEASRKLGSGDFSERVAVDRTDEVGALAALFNTMAEDLEQHEADLRSTQERLAAAQKLEAVGQLAGGIAHDFNNLMHVVGSYADLLHESFDGDDPRRSDAAEIRRASDRATARTRQLLTFSRRDVTQPVPLDTTATITRLEETLRHTLADTVDLRFELKPDLRATVIDAGELEQVLLNLVSNAQSAMPDGGTLTIRTTAVDVEDKPVVEGLLPGGYVAIAVSDTGHGMTEAVRSQALEPFFTTRRDTGGSGLGLATVYGIVTGAGGSIALESVLGGGTTVVVYLPTTSAIVDASTPDEPARTDERGDQTVVLVAEDEPTIRALTTRMLSAQGYTVLSAASGDRRPQARTGHDTDRRAPDRRDHARDDGQRTGRDAHSGAAGPPGRLHVRLQRPDHRRRRPRRGHPVPAEAVQAAGTARPVGACRRRVAFPAVRPRSRQALRQRPKMRPPRVKPSPKVPSAKAPTAIVLRPKESLFQRPSTSCSSVVSGSPRRCFRNAPPALNPR